MNQVNESKPKKSINTIWIVIGGTIVLSLFICFYISVPNLLSISSEDYLKLEPYQRLNAINDMRNNGLGFITAIVISLALYFAYDRSQKMAEQIDVSQEQIKIQQKQLKSLQEGQVTDTFIRAVELLDSKNSSEVQIAGIISLKSLAQKNDRLFHEIIDQLTTFVNNRSIKVSQIDTDDIEKGEIEIFNDIQIIKAFDTIIELSLQSKDSLKLQFNGILIESLNLQNIDKGNCIYFFNGCLVKSVHIKNLDSSDNNIVFYDSGINYVSLEEINANITFRFTDIRSLEISQPVNRLVFFDCLIEKCRSVRLHNQQLPFKVFGSIIRLAGLRKLEMLSDNLNKVFPIESDIHTCYRILDNEWRIIENYHAQFLSEKSFKIDNRTDGFILKYRSKTVKLFLTEND